uniref:Uncharacterized protein n=1 Tax=Cacopsylla melanoneura TaxID=428564 RepID=A0A8D8R5W5_9HEMI
MFNCILVYCKAKPKSRGRPPALTSLTHSHSLPPTQSSSYFFVCFSLFLSPFSSFSISLSLSFSSSFSLYFSVTFSLSLYSSFSFSLSLSVFLFLPMSLFIFLFLFLPFKF